MVRALTEVVRHQLASLPHCLIASLWLIWMFSKCARNAASHSGPQAPKVNSPL